MWVCEKYTSTGVNTHHWNNRCKKVWRSAAISYNECVRVMNWTNKNNAKDIVTQEFKSCSNFNTLFRTSWICSTQVSRMVEIGKKIWSSLQTYPSGISFNHWNFKMSILFFEYSQINLSYPQGIFWDQTPVPKRPLCERGERNWIKRDLWQEMQPN